METGNWITIILQCNWLTTEIALSLGQNEQRVFQAPAWFQIANGLILQQGDNLYPLVLFRPAGQKINLVLRPNGSRAPVDEDLIQSIITYFSTQPDKSMDDVWSAHVTGVEIDSDAQSENWLSTLRLSRDINPDRSKRTKWTKWTQRAFTWAWWTVRDFLLILAITGGRSIERINR